MLGLVFFSFAFFIKGSPPFSRLYMTSTISAKSDTVFCRYFSVLLLFQPLFGLISDKLETAKACCGLLPAC
ncbi:hypothetical protein [Klebsiella pneumoniae]|uniref:hypothetical protein n=1 Tax=Klebsiella pneumoniae TaxID=573 RepID=UPI00224BA319|nr:hypothetical protein [Klebsiella pneumoniae]